MARRGLMAVLVLGAALAALAGCATPVGTAAGPGGAGLAGAGGPVGDFCAGDGSYSPPASLPPEESLTDGAVLTLATRCIGTTERVPGDGEWSVRLDQEATAGLEALAAALRLPSERAAPDQICAAIGYAPIVITVTEDTGRSLRAAIPHTACGAPLKAATDAIAALPWTTTARTRVQRLRTELEVTSGCSGAYKPLIALVALEPPRDAESSTVDTRSREVLTCRYDVGAEEMGVAGGVLVHSGVLVAASTLPPDATHELMTAVNAAPPAAACPTAESPFAVVDPAGASVWVEIGGCHRAWVGRGPLRQLDPAVVARLLG